MGRLSPARRPDPHGRSAPYPPVQALTAELAEKNAELERMNRLFVARELRQVELKTRIRELEKLQLSGAAAGDNNETG